MKAFNATWIGDDDPSAQLIFMGDLRFIKGDAREVPENHPMGEVIFYNPLFDVEEHPEPEPDQGDDRDVVMAELDAAGIKYDGRMKTETLRELLTKG
ncbi:MAG: hypothetical protein ACRCT6_03970 [Notoacmeibacter sp.]